MLESTGWVVSKKLGIKIDPGKYALLEHVFMNIEKSDGFEPRTVCIDPRRNLYNVQTLHDFQPKTKEEKECAELLEKAGLVKKTQTDPLVYILTSPKGTAHAFDIYLARGRRRHFQEVDPIALAYRDG